LSREAFAPPTVDTPLPKRKLHVVERPRFPLVFKLFGLTALLILIVVGMAVGITIERADRIAHDSVNASISSAARLFKIFEKSRLDNLQLGAAPIGHDPTFVAYIQQSLRPVEASAPIPGVATAVPPSAEAAQPIDYASIIDQLREKKKLLGNDRLLLIALDDQGQVLARTDQPGITAEQREDLYEKIPLVKDLVETPSLPGVTGVIPIDDRLYHAAIVPIGAGAGNVRVGYLINAAAIDDGFANSIAESTKAEVVFVPAMSKGGPKASIARSENAPSAGGLTGMQQMSGVSQILKTGKAVPPSDVTIDRSPYVMIGEPLLSRNQPTELAGSKPQPVGAALFVRSLDKELAPFKQIETTLMICGGIALLLAFILSWVIAKRLTRPIEQLAGIAQAVTAGDYSVHPAESSSDEVGILGRSFAKMITSLRDKEELEGLLEQMAVREEEGKSAAAARPLEAARLDEGTVLVTDLRGLPATVGEGDAASVIAAVATAMRLQEAEVQRQDGTVREIVGHRLVSVFRGERGIIHAIRAARAISEELALHSPDPKNPMLIGVGVATGEFVTGSVELTNETGLAIVGNAPLLALLFAWHAPNNFAYISYDTAQAAGGEVLANSSREEVRLRWLPQPLPVAALPLHNLTTGVMRSLGVSDTSSMATIRMDGPGGTVPGLTSPGRPAAELVPGATFAGRYQIEQVLGRGGMGMVYRAVDLQLDETVAIKTLLAEVLMRSPEEVERFKREIRLARKITHRNVLRTYDYGEAEGVYFISMEYVRGYTLAELLEESPRMAPRVVMGVSRQICRGLQAAHEQGIIHRDIKPQNVLIDHKGEVKLMDFGIARMAEAPEAMTAAGLIVGTPHYMSPEQVQGKQLDPRSDVYAMGVMLYEMLAGERPFNSPSLMAVLTAHITDKPRPLIDARPDVGRDINAIVMKCLAKEPKERYANAGEMLGDLDKVQVSAAA
jgi:eukaryotic-like serine/threonine-protein kinase